MDTLAAIGGFSQRPWGQAFSDFRGLHVCERCLQSPGAGQCGSGFLWFFVLFGSKFPDPFVYFLAWPVCGFGGAFLWVSHSGLECFCLCVVVGENGELRFDEELGPSVSCVVVGSSAKMPVRYPRFDGRGFGRILEKEFLVLGKGLLWKSSCFNV